MRIVASGMAVMLLAIGCASGPSEQQGGDIRSFDERHSQVLAPTLTEEASELLDAAIGDCDILEEEIDTWSSGCSKAIWETCWAFQKNISKNSMSTKFLCNSAIIAEGFELASVLALTYGNDYFEYERYSRDISPFAFFHEISNFWLTYLRSVYDSNLSDTEYEDTRFAWLYIERNYSFGNFEIDLRDIPEAILVKLKALAKALADRFYPYNIYASEKRQHTKLPHMRAENSAVVSADKIYFDNADETRQQCLIAIENARLDTKNWQDIINQCLVSARSCSKNSNLDLPDKQTCFETELAAEFELLWQQLPYTCLSAKNAFIVSPDDDCRRLATEICLHPFVSNPERSVWSIPPNPAADFACAASGNALAYRTPPASYQGLFMLTQAYSDVSGPSVAGECLLAINASHAGIGARENSINTCLEGYTNCENYTNQSKYELHCVAFTETLQLSLLWKQHLSTCPETRNLTNGAYVDLTSIEANTAFEIAIGALSIPNLSNQCKNSSTLVCSHRTDWEYPDAVLNSVAKPYPETISIGPFRVEEPILLADLSRRNNKIKNIACRFPE